MRKTLLRAGAAIAMLASVPALAQPGAPAPGPVQAAPQATTAQPAPAAAPAATAPATVKADPALWVVRDRDTTIYLFGTVHILKPGLSWFDAAVRDAFDKSAEVVLEIPMPSPEAAQAAVMKSAVNMTGPALSERLPEGDREAYAKAVADAGLPAGALERLDPWFAASTLTVVALAKQGYDPESGAERLIDKTAKAAGKPVTGLETLEQQFGFFDSLSDESQVAFLSETLKQLPEAGRMVDRMVDRWGAGDPAGLADIMNEGMEATPELTRVLLTDRNARWAEWIADRMKRPGTVFVAVGAGHLAGKGSVQDALAQRRLKAVRVKY